MERLSRPAPGARASQRSQQFITYFEDESRPQVTLDRDIYGGMGVTAGRLREDTLYDYKFVGLAHNTLRGAAGGAVLIAEPLYRLGYRIYKILPALRRSSKKTDSALWRCPLHFVL